MATCVSSESHPFTPSPSFTLKPRGEKCTSSASHFGALRLSPSFGRGLRICSSFDGQDQALFDAQNFEDQVEHPSMAIEPPTWAVKANGEARLEVSSFLSLERLCWKLHPFQEVFLSIYG